MDPNPNPKPFQSSVAQNQNIFSQPIANTFSNAATSQNSMGNNAQRQNQNAQTRNSSRPQERRRQPDNIFGAGIEREKPVNVFNISQDQPKRSDRGNMSGNNNAIRSANLNLKIVAEQQRRKNKRQGKQKLTQIGKPFSQILFRLKKQNIKNLEFQKEPQLTMQLKNCFDQFFFDQARQQKYKNQIENHYFYGLSDRETHLQDLPANPYVHAFLKQVVRVVSKITDTDNLISYFYLKRKLSQRNYIQRFFDLERSEHGYLINIPLIQKIFQNSNISYNPNHLPSQQSLLVKTNSLFFQQVVSSTVKSYFKDYHDMLQVIQLIKYSRQYDRAFKEKFIIDNSLINKMWRSYRNLLKMIQRKTLPTDRSKNSLSLYSAHLSQKDTIYLLMKDSQNFAFRVSIGLMNLMKLTIKKYYAYNGRDNISKVIPTSEAIKIIDGILKNLQIQGITHRKQEQFKKANVQLLLQMLPLGDLEPQNNLNVNQLLQMMKDIEQIESQQFRPLKLLIKSIRFKNDRINTNPENILQLNRSNTTQSSLKRQWELFFNNYEMVLLSSEWKQWLGLFIFYNKQIEENYQILRVVLRLTKIIVSKQKQKEEFWNAHSQLKKPENQRKRTYMTRIYEMVKKFRDTQIDKVIPVLNQLVKQKHLQYFLNFLGEKLNSRFTNVILDNIATVRMGFYQQLKVQKSAKQGFQRKKNYLSIKQSRGQINYFEEERSKSIFQQFAENIEREVSLLALLVRRFPTQLSLIEKHAFNIDEIVQVSGMNLIKLFLNCLQILQKEEAVVNIRCINQIFEAINKMYETQQNDIRKKFLYTVSAYHSCLQAFRIQVQLKERQIDRNQSSPIDNKDQVRSLNYPIDLFDSDTPIGFSLKDIVVLAKIDRSIYGSRIQQGFLSQQQRQIRRLNYLLSLHLNFILRSSELITDLFPLTDIPENKNYYRQLAALLRDQSFDEQRQWLQNDYPFIINLWFIDLLGILSAKQAAAQQNVNREDLFFQITQEPLGQQKRKIPNQKIRINSIDLDSIKLMIQRVEIPANMGIDQISLVKYFCRIINQLPLTEYVLQILYPAAKQRYKGHSHSFKQRNQFLLFGIENWNLNYAIKTSDRTNQMIPQLSKDQNQYSFYQRDFQLYKVLTDQVKQHNFEEMSILDQVLGKISASLNLIEVVLRIYSEILSEQAKKQSAEKSKINYFQSSSRFEFLNSLKFFSEIVSKFVDKNNLEMYKLGAHDHMMQEKFNEQKRKSLKYQSLKGHSFSFYKKLQNQKTDLRTIEYQERVGSSKPKILNIIQVVASFINFQLMFMKHDHYQNYAGAMQKQKQIRYIKRSQMGPSSSYLTINRDFLNSATAMGIQQQLMIQNPCRQNRYKPKHLCNITPELCENILLEPSNPLLIKQQTILGTASRIMTLLIKIAVTAEKSDKQQIKQGSNHKMDFSQIIHSKYLLACINQPLLVIRDKFYNQANESENINRFFVGCLQIIDGAGSLQLDRSQTLVIKCTAFELLAMSVQIEGFLEKISARSVKQCYKMLEYEIARIKEGQLVLLGKIVYLIFSIVNNSHNRGAIRIDNQGIFDYQKPNSFPQSARSYQKFDSKNQRNQLIYLNSRQQQKQNQQVQSSIYTFLNGRNNILNVIFETLIHKYHKYSHQVLNKLKFSMLKSMGNGNYENLIIQKYIYQLIIYKNTKDMTLQIISMVFPYLRIFILQQLSATMLQKSVFFLCSQISTKQYNLLQPNFMVAGYEKPNELKITQKQNQARSKILFDPNRFQKTCWSSRGSYSYSSYYQYDPVEIYFELLNKGEIQREQIRNEILEIRKINLFESLIHSQIYLTQSYACLLIKFISMGKYGYNFSDWQQDSMIPLKSSLRNYEQRQQVRQIQANQNESIQIKAIKSKELYQNSEFRNLAIFSRGLQHSESLNESWNNLFQLLGNLVQYIKEQSKHNQFSIIKGMHQIQNKINDPHLGIDDHNYDVIYFLIFKIYQILKQSVNDTKIDVPTRKQGLNSLIEIIINKAPLNFVMLKNQKNKFKQNELQLKITIPVFPVPEKQKLSVRTKLMLIQAFFASNDFQYQIKEVFENHSYYQLRQSLQFTCLSDFDIYIKQQQSKKIKFQHEQGQNFQFKSNKSNLGQSCLNGQRNNRFVKLEQNFNSRPKLNHFRDLLQKAAKYYQRVINLLRLIQKMIFSHGQQEDAQEISCNLPLICSIISQSIDPLANILECFIENDPELSKMVKRSLSMQRIFYGISFDPTLFFSFVEQLNRISKQILQFFDDQLSIDQITYPCILNLMAKAARTIDFDQKNIERLLRKINKKDILSARKQELNSVQKLQIRNNIDKKFDKSALNLFAGTKHSIWHFNFIANISGYVNGIQYFFFDHIIQNFDRFAMIFCSQTNKLNLLHVLEFKNLCFFMLKMMIQNEQPQNAWSNQRTRPFMEQFFGLTIKCDLLGMIVYGSDLKCIPQNQVEKKLAAMKVTLYVYPKHYQSERQTRRRAQMSRESIIAQRQNYKIQKNVFELIWRNRMMEGLTTYFIFLEYGIKHSQNLLDFVQSSLQGFKQVRIFKSQERLLQKAIWMQLERIFETMIDFTHNSFIFVTEHPKITEALLKIQRYLLKDSEFTKQYSFLNIILFEPYQNLNDWIHFFLDLVMIMQNCMISYFLRWKNCRWVVMSEYSRIQQKLTKKLLYLIDAISSSWNVKDYLSAKAIQEWGIEMHRRMKMIERDYNEK